MCFFGIVTLKREFNLCLFTFKAMSHDIIQFKKGKCYLYSNFSQKLGIS